ncbi:choice-of-anchor Q domain-containing protein [Marinicella sp. W31]|uniref:choice-of-anchor Q domain-containing protein n=1 Tax=Marinicella sp. W31 TaxID=3023713 RepID=UPI0037567553
MKNNRLNTKRTALFTALVLELSSMAHADVITVDGIDCQLADAITAANSNAKTNGCSAGNADIKINDTIDLQGNRIIQLNMALPKITSKLTINGNGATLERQSETEFPILQLMDADLTLNDIHIKNGVTASANRNDGGGISASSSDLTLNRVNISENTGGGLLASSSNLTINDSIIENNVGLDLNIFNIGAAGITLRGGNHLIQNTIVSNNKAYGFSSAGGIEIRSPSVGAASVQITNSTISHNSQKLRRGGAGVFIWSAEFGEKGSFNFDTVDISHNIGGALFSQYSDVTITDSVINNNTSNDELFLLSAGITLQGGSHLIQNTTISNNQTISQFNGAGAGLKAYSWYRHDLILEMNNSTISNNTSESSGGGINLTRYFNDKYSNSATINLNHVTVVGNSANGNGGGILSFSTTLNLSKSLVSGNTANLGSDIFISQGLAVFDDFNLLGLDGDAGVFGAVAGATDIVPTETSLSQIIDVNLIDNGGDTPTHALAAGSPAIDSIPVENCLLSVDQTGKERPLDGDDDMVITCDIGAFEAGTADLIFKNNFDE